MKPLLATKSYYKKLWFVLIIGLLVLPAVPVGYADAPPPEKKIEAIEKQLQALTQAVADLRKDLQPAEESKPKTDKPPASQPALAVKNSSTSAKDKPIDPIALICEEESNRSQVMQTLSYLTDVIGPRLTGSPSLKRANEWASDKLASWGLANAHLEAWGPFGRGWELKRFSAQIIEPHGIPLIGYPKAWSPGLEKPIEAEVVYLDAKSEADLEKYKGKVKGAVVLIGQPRELKPHFEPLALRRTEKELLDMANAGPPSERDGRRGARRTNSPSTTINAMPNWQAWPRQIQSFFSKVFSRSPLRRERGLSPDRAILFLMKEGAALVVTPSYQGDGGTIFIGSASAPDLDNPNADSSWATQRRPSWSADAPAMLPQIVLATEQYNRLVRMIQQGEKLKMAAELQVQYYKDDLMAYNTIAEIPGSDLKDQIVMLGGHIDSWHAGTGATDDATGVAAAMETVRIIKALKLQPRRTIRIGLWSGEEQGLLGSRAYVVKHFGEYIEDKKDDSKSPKEEKQKAPPERKLVRKEEYEKLSVYFNFDEGGGKIRGIWLQGNEAARPIFRRWLEPFKEMGAETISLDNMDGTDHNSFNSIGLPGFHFMQDPIEYWSRTHHGSADVYERVQTDDLKQAATILAVFTYNAAMADEMVPRKKTSK